MDIQVSCVFSPHLKAQSLTLPCQLFISSMKGVQSFEEGRTAHLGEKHRGKKEVKGMFLLN